MMGAPVFCKLLHHVSDMGQNVTAIIFHAEATDPTVENLDDIGSGADLRGGICCGDLDQLAHQRVPVGGRVVHHFFGVDIIAGAAAFDHVAGESEGGSAETDDGNRSGEMFRDQTHGFGDVAKFGGAIGAEVARCLRWCGQASR